MRYLLLSIVIGCGSGPTEVPPPNDSPTGDTGSATTASGATTTTLPQVGNVAFWRTETSANPDLSLYALFASGFGEAAVPAPCALGSRLCAALLPQTIGETIDFTEATIDATNAQFVWLGNSIDIGPYTLQFQVNENTGVGGYARENVQPPEGPMDLITEGQWGPSEAEGAVVQSDPLILTDYVPNEFIPHTPGEDIILNWEPVSDSEMYLELRVVEDFHTITRVSDNGQYLVPTTLLDGLTPGSVLEMNLLRRRFVRDLDISGNTVTIDTWTEVRVLSGPPGLLSCLEHKLNDPTAPSSVYQIQPDPGKVSRAVWCDMNTDGGGWTLVASSDGTTFDDAATGYYADLQTTNPSGGHSAIWDGMRSLTAGGSDIRFTCKKSSGSSQMDVDLSFYANDWYRIITTGTDTASCFNNSDGTNATPPPGRRNNLNGDILPAGDPWNAGYLEGEDSCSDSGDFTVDFDDRGMDSNQSDGTDWGEDDSTSKCGDSGSGEQWHIWVREL